MSKEVLEKLNVEQKDDEEELLKITAKFNGTGKIEFDVEKVRDNN